MRRRHGFLFSPAVPDGIKPVSGVRTRGFFCFIRTSEKKNEFAASVTAAHFPKAPIFRSARKTIFTAERTETFFLIQFVVLLQNLNCLSFTSRDFFIPYSLHPAVKRSHQDKIPPALDLDSAECRFICPRTRIIR
jgi:hypothetical protein